MTRIMVLGGTGLVGGHVIRQLCKLHEPAKVVAPTRRPLHSATEIENPIVDFADLPTDAEWWRVDALICCMGTTIAKAGSKENFKTQDMMYPLNAARLALAAGASTAAITSSLGAASSSGNFYLRTKGAFEEAVIDLGFKSLTIVRPSVISGNRRESRPAERVAVMALRLARPLVPRRYQACPAADIANCLLQSVFADKPGRSILESGDIQRAASR